MPDKWSEASPMESRFGGGFISHGQFLAETLCARKARSKATELPHKFWQTGVWKREFLSQLRVANSLLKTYSYTAIAKALRDPKGRNVYSLSAPWLDQLIRVEQERLDVKAAIKPEAAPVVPPPVIVIEPPRAAFQEKSSSLSKLRSLD